MVKPVTWDPSPQTALDRLKGKLFATTTECAAVLRYDVRTLRKAIEAGEIPAVRAGSTYRIPTAWLRQQTGVEGGNAAASELPEQARSVVEPSAERRPAEAYDPYAYNSALEERKAKRTDRLTRQRSRLGGGNAA